MLDAELAVALGADERVEGDDAHAEALRALGDELADAAEAEDAERLVHELDAASTSSAPSGPAIERGVRLRDVAGEREQQRERVLGGGDDVGLRRVGDDDAALGRGGDVDVVDADAGAADRLAGSSACSISSAVSFVAERMRMPVVVADALVEVARPVEAASTSKCSLEQRRSPRVADVLGDEDPSSAQPAPRRSRCRR